MSYKYEMHCHTGCVSRCGRVEPEEIVTLYQKKEYSGIVVTDHYSPMTWRPARCFCPQRDIDFYLSGYRRMKAAADPDFTVLLGMELRRYGTANDYLIYGLTEEFLMKQKNLMLLSEKKVKELCEKNGLLVYQAHPFRPGIRRTKPEYIDGVEVYNGKTGDEQNALALNWARKNHKLMISGSDFHRPEQLAKGGIITDKPIKNNNDLLNILKQNDYKLINV